MGSGRRHGSVCLLDGRQDDGLGRIRAPLQGRPDPAPVFVPDRDFDRRGVAYQQNSRPVYRGQGQTDDRRRSEVGAARRADCRHEH